MTETFKKATIIVFVLVACIFVSCNNVTNTLYSCKENQILLSIDSLNSFEIPERIEILVDSVCSIGCAQNKGYTGQYSLKYSLKNRSFTNFSGDQFILNIPFIGYKCPNSSLDFFYTKKEILLNNHSDDLSSKVRNHIAETRSNNTHPSIFDIIVEEDHTSINDLSNLVYQILIGYYQLYQEYALLKWGKGISDLSPNEIELIKQWEPIRIRILTLDREIYCNE